MTNQLNEHVSIVVDVDNPTCDVFIAFPFAMLDVVRLVEDAIRKADQTLRIYRVDFDAVGTSFVDDIVTRTRGARMVIGICTPETEGGKPNPNVMYKLGLADALGKVTLAVTTNPKTLPADIAQIRAFVYTSHEIGGDHDRGFVDRLGREILKLEKFVPKDRPLIDARKKHVWVAKADERLVLTQAFWGYVKAVVDLTSGIRSEASVIRTNLNKFQESARKMLNPKADLANVSDDLLERWENCYGYYQQRLQRLISMDTGMKHVKQCFDNLKRGSGGAGALPALVGDYQNFEKTIDCYKELIEKINETYTNALHADQGTKTNFYATVNALCTSARSLEEAAASLMHNLITTASAMYHPPQPIESTQ